MPRLHPRDELPLLRASIRLGDKDAVPTVSFYDVQFYPFCEPGVDPVFALTGADCVWVCRPKYSKDTSIEVLLYFRDHEITTQDPGNGNKQQELNSVCWTKDAVTGDPLVIIASNVPKINILNVKTGELVRTLIGHGAEINDLKVSPINPDLLASASMDYTVRLWNLDSKHVGHPCCSILAGEGQREGLLALAWHRSGRFLLTGGHDAVVNLWSVPDTLYQEAGTDRVDMIYYPHFSSNEVHNHYIDCLQWYDDLILSHCTSDGSIYLWRIDGFNPDQYGEAHPLPLAPPPKPYHPSFTRSAFGDGFTHLLTFDVKHCDLIYQRFSLFHMPAKRPILCAGNDKSKVHFWDLQRLEEERILLTRTSGSQRSSTQKPGEQPPVVGPDAHKLGDGAAAAEQDAGDSNTAGGSAPDDTHDSSGLFRVPSRRKRNADSHGGPPQTSWARSESVASDAATSTTTTSAGGLGGVAGEYPQPPQPGQVRARGRRKGKDSEALTEAKYDISDPFRALKPHRETIVPKVTFCIRQVAWSPGGEWCVVCGDNGMVALFSRWFREES